MIGRRALPLALSTLAILASGCANTFPSGSNILGVTSIEWSRARHPMTTNREVRFESDAPTSTLSRLVPAGSLPVIEWLHFDGGRIRAINLYYDQLPWKGVLDEMKRRSTEQMA